MSHRSASIDLAPDPRLQFDPSSLDLLEFPREFFRRATDRVARDLIGAWFAREHLGRWYGARIVETEAYLGAGDAAAHSYRGRRTPRVEPMYRDGGHLYVFLVYGMHHCANIVTRDEGIAEAVLLRAAEGPDGAASAASPASLASLMSGPGKLCAALGITVLASGIDLLAQGALRLFQSSDARGKIGVSPRIGVDYAGEAAAWPLRFFDTTSRAVSGPVRMRKPEP